MGGSRVVIVTSCSDCPAGERGACWGWECSNSDFPPVQKDVAIQQFQFDALNGRSDDKGILDFIFDCEVDIKCCDGVWNGQVRVGVVSDCDVDIKCVWNGQVRVGVVGRGVTDVLCFRWCPWLVLAWGAGQWYCPDCLTFTLPAAVSTWGRWQT